MKMHSESAIQVASISLASGNWRRSQPSASTHRSAVDREFRSYITAACGLMLMMLLVVAVVAYAGLRGTLRVHTTASSARVADSKAETELSRAMTPTAAALGLLGALLLAVSATPSHFDSFDSSPAAAAGQVTQPRNSSSFIVRN